VIWAMIWPARLHRSIGSSDPNRLGGIDFPLLFSQ
jgi:hypothetical protein